MNTKMENWDLDSGVWLRTTTPRHWEPISRADGRVFHSDLTANDRLHLVQTRVTAKGDESQAHQVLFPADFNFDPDTGEKLIDRTASIGQPWLPPHGAAVRGPGVAPQLPVIRGLRQTAHILRISPNKPLSGATRTVQDEPDRTIPVPPPGHYEFASGRFAADVDTLLAIEPEHGTLFVWLTTGSRWAKLEGPSGGTFLAHSSLQRKYWSAELESSEHTCLFLPTDSGLAVVIPDVLALSYSVEYLGAGMACWGAPVRWNGAIWVPLRNPAGTITLLSVPVDDQVQATSQYATTLHAPSETLASPVCSARQIVWPSFDGQLVLSKATDGGKPQIDWLHWPDGFAPELSFGAPYLSVTGQFWQLCREQSEQTFVYIQLGKKTPETHPTDSPALCTGRRSYKMTSSMNGDPWEDPQGAVHADSSKVFVPILESSSNNAAVLGLVINAPHGVTSLLDSKERYRAELHLQTNDRPVLCFQTVFVRMPWRIRALVFDGCLWLYHPELQVLLGTELELQK